MAKFKQIELHDTYDDAPRPVAAMAKSFADGAHTAVHRHGRGQLLHAVRGIMRIETADAAWLVPPARALWMPPSLAHRVTMRSQVEMRTLYIDPRAASALPRSPTLVEVSGLLRELILAALEEPAAYDQAARLGRARPRRPRRAPDPDRACAHQGPTARAADAARSARAARRALAARSPGAAARPRSMGRARRREPTHLGARLSSRDRPELR